MMGYCMQCFYTKIYLTHLKAAGRWLNKPLANFHFKLGSKKSIRAIGRQNCVPSILREQIKP